MTVKLHPKSCILVFMIACLLFQGCGQAEEQNSQSAPDFTLQDLSGNEVSLRQHKGQVVLLDFWATWCAPCRRSIPELVRIQDKYRDQGLVVLGISVDDPQKIGVNSLLAFKNQFKINYSILRADQNVTRAYFRNGQIPLPTLFVIYRDGEVVDSIVGNDPRAVERSLNTLI